MQEEKRVLLKQRIEIWDMITFYLKISEISLPSKYNCNYIEWKINSNTIVLYLDENNEITTIKNGESYEKINIATAVHYIRTWYKNYKFLDSLK